MARQLKNKAAEYIWQMESATADIESKDAMEAVNIALEQVSEKASKESGSFIFLEDLDEIIESLKI